MIITWIFILFVSCSGIKQDIVDNIDYKIIGVNIDTMKNMENILGAILEKEMSKVSNGILKIKLNIINNNSVDITIKRLEYSVFINDIYVGEGALSKLLNSV